MKLHSLRILLAEYLIIEPTPLFAAFFLWYFSPILVLALSSGISEGSLAHGRRREEAV